MPVKISGVAISGFRDIREPVYIGPLAQVNFLGGANNSGKTAILDGIALALREKNLSSLEMEPLDVPQYKPEGKTPPFEMAILLNFSDAPSVGSGFIESVTGQQVPSDRARYVTALLENDSFRGGFDADLPMRWFWLTPSDQEQLSPRHQRHLVDSQLLENAMQQVQSSGYSGSISWGAFILRAVQGAGRYEGVYQVPSARAISSTDYRGSTLPSKSGKGFPGMLLSMLAPRAEEYYASKLRLERINSFVREVLQRDTAELLVPHDAETVHVALEDRVLPLSRMGAGIEQVVLLAAICTEYENSLVMIEEPDAYLHPTLQRQLLHYLKRRTTNTYLCSTHSAALLDTDEGNVWGVDWDPEQGTKSQSVTSADGRASLAHRLGFRASDLVQANFVIWVEGPSDRIYLKRWLEIQNPKLLEHVHYSFIMYGGVLGEHLSASDEASGRISRGRLDDFILVSRINRNSVFVMDSDLVSVDNPLSTYKTRIIEEFRDKQTGFAWVTSGYTIENYLPVNNFSTAYEAVHSRTSSPYGGDVRKNPFKGGVKQPDKIAIARRVCDDLECVPDVEDLRGKIAQLAKLIALVNEAPHPLGAAEQPTSS